MRENISLLRVPTDDDAATIVKNVGSPISKEGTLKILNGSLAPEGAVIKIANLKDTKFRGKAKYLTQKRRPLKPYRRESINPGDVLVIRYEGPKGGPGMREMLSATAALVGQGISDSVVMVTDGRFSGATRGQ